MAEFPILGLSSRPPFARLRERDIDLLVCAELYARGELTKLLGQRLGLSEGRFEKAWVSHPETDGESDLVIAFSFENTHVIALLENKIAAAFQPDQVQRYAARSQRWSQMEGVSRVVTVLLAPGEYMKRSGAEGFEVRISYEEASAALRAELDARAVFLADALAAGVEACQRGYVKVPDESVSAMWQGCWQIALRVAPSLNFAQPGLKPGGSNWIYFRAGEGFSKEDGKRVVVVYKAERGQADLQFCDTTLEILSRRASGILDHDMKVVPAGQSVSIRVAVPEIDFSGMAEAQEVALTEGFAACERLRAFFVEHRNRLLGFQLPGFEQPARAERVHGSN